MHDQNGDRNDVRKGVTEPRLSEAFVKDLVKRHNCPITTRAVNALTAGELTPRRSYLSLLSTTYAERLMWVPTQRKASWNFNVE